ncbi:alanine dehydrogenase [Pseudoflavonifractor sp. MSJ-37]|uniref:alanine dehydrogenase n=1 Tax=Pseudoflavonifractor sp. MSJ-37 TaxID=2841531 RepID=UPI001C120B81|nr:NAD(P)-dependent oxidoreductase [Pseudoflavonifractor sp. MSJ-37]MBU5435173.1 alanine dehydrogenase [Pseudoflavonifractor sp. MSJ-37]
MIFGILKDIKEGEYRVICTPMEVRSIVAAGHEVWAQHDCGLAAGFTDEKYAEAGARIVDSAAEIWAGCDMVAKVKEFVASEYDMIRKDQILLGCIHPAGHPAEVDALLKSGCIAFTAEDAHRYGSPNCEAAGKVGALLGLESMMTINGGKGKFVGGFAGAPGMNVLIMGAGTVGQAALQVLHSLGAKCTVMDINVGILRTLMNQYKGDIDTMFCNKETIASVLPQTDMVLNCVKWPKERTDFLIDKEMLKLMEPGSVLVDISNDDPGAIESSHETHFDDPRYVVNGVVHYCVSNMPSAVANTTSVAYAAEMLPMILSILNDGVAGCCVKDGFYRRSLTAYKGWLTHEETSAIQSRPWIRPEDILGIADQRLDPAPPATVTRSSNFYEKK